ncbi:hypothetical protein D3C72_1637070 [compost metagenome]
MRAAVMVVRPMPSPRKKMTFFGGASATTSSFFASLPQAASIRVMATLQPATEIFLRVMWFIRLGLKELAR